MRVGLGYDVHRLVAGRPLVLGGVTVPFEKGLLGHSDADVICHAVGDALLGAAALGDLGSHFPDDDPRWKDISSLKLLGEVKSLVREKGFQIVNIDATLVAERPRIGSHVPKMRQHLAEALEMPVEQVSIKATTTEGLGFAGSGQGMVAYAVALVDESP
ncbi:2-C-methyl-D-erythritol 2,4-cyclodiphosphate synthase [bacterium]|nr:2-C-methyl-D-erythritol 2,4-cyclodiphosphate synthase [bacterium]